MTSLALILTILSGGSANDAPYGFRKADESDILQLGVDDDVESGYMLSFLDNRLRIETRVEWVQREGAESKGTDASKGAKFKIDLGSAKVYWKKGDGTPVEDGWLKGFDAGEFGGGLYWFAKDASGYKRINQRNTQMVIDTPKGVFAVQSLTHFTFGYSDLVEVKKGKSGWETRVITNLHVSPSEILRAGDRFIYATNEYVSILNTDGTQREIYHASMRVLNPESMVRRPNGEIWVGSVKRILRLIPKGNDIYAAQWYLPKSLKRVGL